jgi:hypothetical protein
VSGLVGVVGVDCGAGRVGVGAGVGAGVWVPLQPIAMIATAALPKTSAELVRMGTLGC